MRMAIGTLIDTRLLRRAPTARGALIRIGLLSAGGGLLTLGQAWSLSLALDLAFLQASSLRELAAPLTIVLTASLGRALIHYAVETSAGRLASQVKSDLRQALLERLLHLGPIHAIGERIGELSATAVEGIEALDGYFRQYLPQLAVAAVLPLLLVAVVLPIDAISGLILALTAPLLPVFMFLIGRAADRLAQRQFGWLRTFSARFLDILNGLPTLKLLGRSGAQADVIRDLSRRYRLASLEVLRVAFLSALALEMVATLSTALVAVQVGLRLLHGGLPYREAMFLLILAPEFYLPLRSLGGRFHARAAGLAAARRIFEILDAPGLRPVTSNVSEAARRTPPEAFTITFEQVHAAFPDGRHALRSASFQIRPRGLTALVGPSGAGKSTVASLLLRFLEPSEGRILIDAAPLGEFDLRAWRARLAWVPQSPQLVAGTIADNLRIAHPDATLEDMRRALEQAQLAELLESLPEGLETPIGEGGARLSAGQVQRLAIARAFVREASFLILDEPTSAVDPDLEDRLRTATERLLDGRTGLVIAHRMSTIYRADRILVMAQGRVVESGTHTELWARGGLYRRMLVEREEGG